MFLFACYVLASGGIDDLMFLQSTTHAPMHVPPPPSPAHTYTAYLQAFECEQCGRFYQACTSWGCLPSNAGPSCGHGTAGIREALRSEGGRHRYRFPPPPTPEGYWDISFTPPGKEEADAAGWEEVHAHYEQRL